MTWMLGIDCTDQACSVALGNGVDMIERYTDEPRQHAQRVLPMMRSLLDEAAIDIQSLDAISVTVGPGSFTGLRIGLSTAQSLAYGLSIPIVPVSSLLALSYASDAVNTPLFVGLDARMGEVYCAAFTGSVGGERERLVADCLLSETAAADLAATYDGGVAIGSALALAPFAERVFSEKDERAQIHAKHVVQLGFNAFSDGQGVDPLSLEPAYLRREDAWSTVAQQSRNRAQKNAT